MLGPLLIALALGAAVPRDQTLVVVTPTWSAVRGTATLYEGGRPVVGPVPAWVGHAGLGWGRGLVPAQGPGPAKREGDGRSPAGLFRLGPTWRGTQGGFCVDDPASPAYNRVTRHRGAAASAEPMAMYRVAVSVGHNAERRPGAGSCIFLHDGDAPTVGCTALRPRDLDRVVRRLGPWARLVQLPAAVYRTVASRWRLPAR